MEIQQELLQECLPIEVNGICLKPIMKYLKLLSKKWMIFIIMIFPDFTKKSTPESKKKEEEEKKALRYTEIKSRIQNFTSEKISDTTLSLRLNELCETMIINREQFEQIPPRVEYKLSSKGIKLKDSLQPLIIWAINDCHET